MTKEKEMRIKRGLLTIGEIAKETGIPKSTIRYYTDIGLLKVSAYSKGGYRLYEKDLTIERIRKVRPPYERRKTLKEKVTKEIKTSTQEDSNTSKEL